MGAPGLGQAIELEFYRFLRKPTAPCRKKTIICHYGELDAGLVALEQRRDKTRAIKQGMMQGLLTWKSRLV
jgi:type I restriction enzyme S subunit